MLASFKLPSSDLYPSKYSGKLSDMSFGSIWRFSEIGSPNSWMVDFMEPPIYKWMIWGHPYFRKPPYGSIWLMFSDILPDIREPASSWVWLGSVPRLGARDERHSTLTWQTSREDEERSRAGEERKTCCCEKI